MPFPFVLPTTSSVLLSDCFDSVTHPSLPLVAATHRNILRDALKRHKRLPAGQKPAHLSTVLDAVRTYVPYLLALNTGAAYRAIGPEKVDLQIIRPLQIEWRSTLAASLPGRDPPRPALIGLHFETAFVLLTLAYAHVLLPRRQIRTLGGAPGAEPLTLEQRTQAVSGAMKSLLEAHAIYTYLLTLSNITASSATAPIDVQTATISALAALSMAEATLIVVAKDDPYAVAVAETRNTRNTDWMFKAPSIPPTRAHLLARIALAAAEHASRAHGLLSSITVPATSTNRFRNTTKITDDLIKYTLNLQRTARAKAARFLAVNAEASSKTGEALAWLQGARQELGLNPDFPDDDNTSTRRKGFRGLKQTLQELREDRRAGDPGANSTNSSDGHENWGLDAGWLEEARVIESLASKWSRENNTINIQIIPPFAPLLANGFPSGREYHSPAPVWTVPELGPEDWAKLRAPPDPEDCVFRGDEDDSDEDSGVHAAQLHSPNAVVGAFPGSTAEYGTGGDGPAVASSTSGAGYF